MLTLFSAADIVIIIMGYQLNCKEVIMKEREIIQIVQKQRHYFQTGATLPIPARMEALKKLRASVRKHEKDIHRALMQDLGKSNFESYMCETGLTLNEISHMINRLPNYAGEKKVRTPLAQFHSKSFQKPSPYGVVLIMSPWNYPFLLSMEPLTDALAAGNTVVLKPSACSPHTSAILQHIISECFDSAQVAVITGGHEENTSLLNRHFDYIFFTGSRHVGKEVLKKAADHLTPVTLELGGKSPCIVDRTANLRLAARRIVFGKFLNCGQTCVAPDYIYCDKKIKDELLNQICIQIRKQFSTDPLGNKNYGRIINQKHFERLLRLMDKSKIVYGGDCDPSTLRIAPSVMDSVTFDDPVMQEEIFGPVLPVLTYDSLDHAIEQISALPHPLALYLFTSDKKTSAKILSRIGFGGGCINDVIIHLATSQMGFGGFGESGMGSYHGKAGFDTFSHYKSIVDKKTWIDLPIRYQPYRSIYEKLLRFFLK